MRITGRELARVVLLEWLDNWGRWVGGGNRACIGVSDAAANYTNPQSSHWEPPSARVVPVTVFPWPAAIVEDALHVPTFDGEWRAAVRATHYALPSERLRAEHWPADRWDGKRARAAGQRFQDYRDNLDAGYVRLARDLWVWRHALPVAA